MRGSEPLLTVVAEWMEKAEHDLANAAVALKAADESLADTVAFHAQQCAEKYLKALLTLKMIDFPRTHDLGALIAQAPGIKGMDLSVTDQRRLTAYATLTRYPGEYEPVTLAEARRAVALARRVRKAVRTVLPRKALVRRPR